MRILAVQVQLLGQQISVGRPSGYVDPSKAQEAAAAAAAALTAFQVMRVCTEVAAICCSCLLINIQAYMFLPAGAALPLAACPLSKQTPHTTLHAVPIRHEPLLCTVKQVFC